MARSECSVLGSRSRVVAWAVGWVAHCHRAQGRLPRVEETGCFGLKVSPTLLLWGCCCFLALLATCARSWFRSTSWAWPHQDVCIRGVIWQLGFASLWLYSRSSGSTALFCTAASSHMSSSTMLLSLLGASCSPAPPPPPPLEECKGSQERGMADFPHEI